MKLLKQILIFILTFGVCTFVAWMSGYNFDRGEYGFLWASLSLIISSTVTLASGDFL